jgi:hypothetical protein
MYPFSGLDADGIENAPLQIVQWSLISRRQFTFHDLAEDVVAAGPVLENRPGFA